MTIKRLVAAAVAALVLVGLGAAPASAQNTIPGIGGLYKLPIVGELAKAVPL